MYDILRCPVCGENLTAEGGRLFCTRGHSFDMAKEGYVNLLSGGHKSGEEIGDNRQMARSRKNFLDKGYYSPLADAAAGLLEQRQPKTVLDICCGEGYYTEYLSKRYRGGSFYGFDISKEMVRLAAKRRCGASLFVANISRIPIRDESVDFAFHFFAPFHSGEFYRIIKQGGMLVTAIPGKRHLFGLKQVLYDTPYENDEALPDVGNFKITRKIKVRDEITLTDSEDMLSLLQMTPYYYHTPTEGINKLCALSSLTTEIEFVLVCCEK